MQKVLQVLGIAGLGILITLAGAVYVGLLFWFFAWLGGNTMVQCGIGPLLLALAMALLAAMTCLTLRRAQLLPGVLAIGSIAAIYGGMLYGEIGAHMMASHTATAMLFTLATLVLAVALDKI